MIAQLILMILLQTEHNSTSIYCISPKLFLSNSFQTKFNNTIHFLAIQHVQSTKNDKSENI